MVETALNALGLIAVTVGGVGAAFCAPSPRYNADGSVSVGAEQDREKRISMHRRQKLLKPLLALVGVGALLQLAALFVSQSH